MEGSWWDWVVGKSKDLAWRTGEEFLRDTYAQYYGSPGKRPFAASQYGVTSKVQRRARKQRSARNERAYHRINYGEQRVAIPVECKTLPLWRMWPNGMPTGALFAGAGVKALVPNVKSDNFFDYDVSDRTSAGKTSVKYSELDLDKPFINVVKNRVRLTFRPPEGKYADETTHMPNKLRIIALQTRYQGDQGTASPYVGFQGNLKEVPNGWNAATAQFTFLNYTPITLGNLFELMADGTDNVIIDKPMKRDIIDVMDGEDDMLVGFKLLLDKVVTSDKQFDLELSFPTGVTPIGSLVDLTSTRLNPATLYDSITGQQAMVTYGVYPTSENSIWWIVYAEDHDYNPVDASEPYIDAQWSMDYNYDFAWRPVN